MFNAGLFAWASTQVLFSRRLAMVKCRVCQGAGCLAREGEPGVTGWQAGRNPSGKGPVPQHLNEGIAGSVRIARSRQEPSDRQTSLVTRRVQGQVKKSRQSESSARRRARCRVPIIQFREGPNASLSPMGRGCLSGKPRWDFAQPCFSHLPCFYGTLIQGYTARWCQSRLWT